MHVPRSKRRRFLSAAAAAALYLSTAGGGALAQASASLSQSDEPLTIEADTGIEWHQNEKTYVARGNALAQQGDVTVRADVLTAHYRDAEDSNPQQIWKVIAQGGVKITTSTQTIVGDHGIYNVDTGVFVITGRRLKLETPDETVTARDKLEYRTNDRVAVAEGDATAIREDRIVKADRFEARFVEDAKGELVLDRVDAVGNVRIVTQGETAAAERGVYNAATGIATLDGDVRLTRGDNHLNGERAEVDLNTGVSKLMAGEGGRVRGLILPREGDDGPLTIAPGSKSD